MSEFIPITDTDGREVSVRSTGFRGNIGIHSWSKAWGHSAVSPAQEAPSRSIFLTLVNAKHVRDQLTAEIDHLEGRR